MPLPNSGFPASYYVHPHSLVETLDIGEGAIIWAFVHVLKGAKIGSYSTICDHCFVENEVVIGNNVTIKCGIYLWNGVSLEDNVFLGPNVVFTNDLHPRSKNTKFTLSPTRICKGASIGANSTILAGVTVGRFAMAGIGSVITRDVKNYALVYGNPARQYGWVDEEGKKLLPNGAGCWRSSNDIIYRETSDGLQVEE